MTEAISVSNVYFFGKFLGDSLLFSKEEQGRSLNPGLDALICTRSTTELRPFWTNQVSKKRVVGMNVGCGSLLKFDWEIRSDAVRWRVSYWRYTPA